MNTQSLTAKMLSRFKDSLDSWFSLWSFLADLHDVDFYQGLEDPQREICLELSDSLRERVPGQRSRPIAGVGTRGENFPQKSANRARTGERVCPVTNRVGTREDPIPDLRPQLACYRVTKGAGY